MRASSRTTARCWSFGPTNATIHQTDERISIDELKATAKVYRRILDSYFKV